MTSPDPDKSSSSHVDAICDRFEAALQSGSAPRIEDFLVPLPGDSDSSLLLELVKMDLDYRSKQGESPTPDEYADRFPEHAALILGMLADLLQSKVPGHNAAPLASTVLEPPSKPTEESPRRIGPYNRLQISSTSLDTLPGTIASKRGSRIRYFGDYELLNEIARGGMGVVYKARQIKLNRVVALKMILAGHLASEEDVKRFYNEAEAAANLDHPAIVPIYEIGTHEGQHFFSMGFIEGSSLANRVKLGPLPPREAAEITMKLAAAIAYAHENGVIHRDLKPANVLLDRLGEPKVTDFGLAKNVTHDSSLTQTGAVMGTPSYMPPEQASGKTNEVGPLSDVYSLGAILYCLLTGRPPFQSSNVLETLKQVVEVDPVSPKMLNPEIDKDLETLCLRCLEKDRQQRLRSAQFLAKELERYLNGFPIRSRRSGYSERLQKWCLRNRAEAALIVTIALAVLLSSSLLAVAGLSKIEKLFGTDAVSRVLFVLCLFGPLVSVARLLGLRGVRTFELTLMKIWKNCICSILAAVSGFMSFAGLVVVSVCMGAFFRGEGDIVPLFSLLLFLFQLLFATWVQMKYDLEPGVRWMWGLIIIGFIFGILALGSKIVEIYPAFQFFSVISIVFAAGAFIAVELSTAYGFARLVYSSAHVYANSVKETFGWVPWPFSMAEGPFRIRNLLFLTNLFPVAFLIGFFQLLLSLAMLIVVLPIWPVEQLRLILLPNSPMVMESLCYLISFGAFATLVASLVL